MNDESMSHTSACALRSPKLQSATSAPPPPLPLDTMGPSGCFRFKEFPHSGPAPEEDVESRTISAISG